MSQALIFGGGGRDGSAGLSFSISSLGEEMLPHFQRGEGAGYASPSWLPQVRAHVAQSVLPGVVPGTMQGHLHECVQWLLPPCQLRVEGLYNMAFIPHPLMKMHGALASREGDPQTQLCLRINLTLRTNNASCMLFATSVATNRDIGVNTA